MLTKDLSQQSQRNHGTVWLQQRCKISWRNSSLSWSNKWEIPTVRMRLLRLSNLLPMERYLFCFGTVSLFLKDWFRIAFNWIPWSLVCRLQSFVKKLLTKTTQAEPLVKYKHASSFDCSSPRFLLMMTKRKKVCLYLEERLHLHK